MPFVDGRFELDGTACGVVFGIVVAEVQSRAVPIGQPALYLHDVYLAVARPTAVLVMRAVGRGRLRKHPERGPHAVAARGFDLCLDIAESEIELAARRDTPGGVPLAADLFRFLFGGDGHHAVLDCDIVLGVILLLVVAPVGRTLIAAVVVARARLVAPIIHVERVAVELVVPYQLVSVLDKVGVVRAVIVSNGDRTARLVVAAYRVYRRFADRDGCYDAVVHLCDIVVARQPHNVVRIRSERFALA